jgi:hypothetical protein
MQREASPSFIQDANDVPVLFGDPTELFVDGNVARRTAVAAYYYFECDAAPPTNGEVDARTVGEITERFKFWNISRNFVKTTLGRVLAALRSDTLYDPTHPTGPGSGFGSLIFRSFCSLFPLNLTHSFEFRPNPERRHGPLPKVAPGSEEAEMICDLLEQGHSLKQTFYLVNMWLYRKGLSDLSMASIVAHYHRCAPKVTAPKRRKQGDTDPEADWSKCVDADVDTIPRCFDRAVLPEYTIDKTIFWDEKHRKVSWGVRPGKAEVRFRRNAEGKVDLDAGTFGEGKEYMRVKYPGEARLCLGFGKKTPGLGGDDGYCLPVWDYTDRTLISYKHWSELRKKEIARVKASGKAADWWEGRPAQNEFFHTSPTTDLPKCGKKGAEDLANHMGLQTVGDVANLPDTSPKLEKIEDCCFSPKKFQMWQTAARAADEAISEERLATDFRQSDNPFKAKYGKDWQKHMLDWGLVKAAKVKPVHFMVEHIFEESKKAVGCGEDYFVYHDALSLMTAGDCRNWMKKHGYWDHWILPREGLNDMYPAYANRPVGNQS